MYMPTTPTKYRINVEMFGGGGGTYSCFPPPDTDTFVCVYVGTCMYVYQLIEVLEIITHSAEEFLHPGAQTFNAISTSNAAKAPIEKLHRCTCAHVI